jgi:hypothetical protein
MVVGQCNVALEDVALYSIIPNPSERVNQFVRQFNNLILDNAFFDKFYYGKK